MTDLDWHKLPPLSALRAFEGAARLGGFSAAARALNVTPAAIAQQVRGLEAELGVRLVRRDGRGIALTPAGQELAARLGDGFAAIAAGVQNLLNADRTRGFRVLTTAFIVDALIMPRMNEFWQKHPGTEVAFTPGQCDSPLSAEFFDRQQFDVAIMTGSGDWPGVDAELLLDSALVAVGTAALCDRARRDMASVPWIWDRSDPLIPEVMQAAGLEVDRIAHMDVGNPRLELSAARLGHGLTLATEVVVRADLQAGTLDAIPLPGIPRVPYYVATPSGPRHPALAKFVAWLHELAADWQRSEPAIAA